MPTLSPSKVMRVIVPCLLYCLLGAICTTTINGCFDSTYRTRCRSVLKAFKDGRISSAEDLESQRTNMDGPFHISIFAKDLEYPDPMIVGKILKYRFLKEADIVWELPVYCTDSTSSGSMVEGVRMLAAADSVDHALGKKLKLGEHRIYGLSQTPRGLEHSTQVGAKMVTYQFETERAFYKMTFITDGDDILAIDISQ